MNNPFYGPNNQPPMPNKDCMVRLTTAAILTPFLLLLHRVLLGIMADKNWLSVIFAGGRGLEIWQLLLVLLFFITRILVLTLPGILLAQLGLLLWDCRGKWRE
jgi:hypothetical protein